MSLRDVFIIKEEKPPFRVIPGGKPAGEEYGPQDRVGFLYDVGEEEPSEREPHMVASSEGGTPQQIFANDVEASARGLMEIGQALGKKMDFETFMDHVEHVREVVSYLRFEADRMLRLRDYL